MQQKKIPMRKCTGCGGSFPKRELLRIVKTPEDKILVDFSGKLSGRGAYICPKAQCLAAAQKARRLERAFESAVPQEVIDRLTEEIELGQNS